MTIDRLQERQSDLPPELREIAAAFDAARERARRWRPRPMPKGWRP